MEFKYNASYSDKDFQQAAQRSSRGSVGQTTDLSDAFNVGMAEGNEYNPTRALINLASKHMGNNTMTSSEANEKYGLHNTPFAFKDETTSVGEPITVSDSHAQHVANLWEEKQYTTSLKEMVDQEQGLLADVVMFGGNMTAGAIDPINLLAGMGLGAVTKSVATSAGSSVLKKWAAQTTLKSTLAVQAVENLAASAAIDATLVPAGSEAVNQPLGASQRIANIIGATVMGTFLGTAFQGSRLLKARKADIKNNKVLGQIRDQVIEQQKQKLADTRIITHKVGKQYGTKGADLVVDANVHAERNMVNGVKPDPDHVLKKREMEWHSTRPDQTPHVHDEIFDTPQGKTMYVGKDADGNLSSPSDHGNGSVEVIDNYNLSHNLESSLDGKLSGEVAHMKVADDANLVMGTHFEDDVFKRDLSRQLARQFPELPQLARAVHEATDIASMKDIATLKTTNFAGLPNIDDAVNSALKEMGYHGYHFVGEAGTVKSKYNGIAMLDDSKMTHLETVPTTKFDGNHPDSQDFLKPMKDLDKAEIDRYSDYRQKLGYDADAETALKNVQEMEDFQSSKDLRDLEDVDAFIAREDTILPEGVSKEKFEAATKGLDEAGKVEYTKALRNVFDCVTGVGA